MHLGFARDARMAIRPPVAMFTAACGAATAVGSLLTWLSARGARPSIGMRHTSLAQMLVYTFANADPFWKSVGGAVLVLGAAMVFGALAGLRTLAILAALLALGTGGMWIGLVVHHYNTPGLPNIHYANPANLPWQDLPFHHGHHQHQRRHHPDGRHRPGCSDCRPARRRTALFRRGTPSTRAVVQPRRRHPRQPERRRHRTRRRQHRRLVTAILHASGKRPENSKY
jgi:hypothetical protein